LGAPNARGLRTPARTGATSPGFRPQTRTHTRLRGNTRPYGGQLLLSLPEQNIHSPALDEHSPVRGLPYPGFHFQARTHTLARVGTGTLTPYGGHLAFLPSSFPFPSPAPVHPAFFPEHTPTSSEHSGGSGHSPVREPLYPASTARPKHTHSPALDTCPYGGHFTQLPLLDRRTHTRLRGNTCPYGGHFTRLSLSLPDYRDAYTRPRRNRNARAVRGSRLVFLPLLAFSSKRTARVACLPSRQEGTTSHKHSL
jgi:hypothetical protein